MQTAKKRRTLIRFAVQSTTYVEGEGNTTKWETIKVKIGTDETSKPILTENFYCEWLNSFGSTAIQQQSDGIICPARVRMVFVKAVYVALLNSDVKIYKNGLSDAAHTFKLASAPDNYVEGDKLLEFQVKQREVK